MNNFLLLPPLKETDASPKGTCSALPKYKLQALARNLCKPITAEHVLRNRPQYDPLTYPRSFEENFKKELELFLACLSYTSQRDLGISQRRRLTRLEHQTLTIAAISQIFAQAVEGTEKFHRVDPRRATSLAFLLGCKKALSIAHSDKLSDLQTEHLLRLLGLPGTMVDLLPFARCANSLDAAASLVCPDESDGIRLTNKPWAYKIHYLSQRLSFTTLPKNADEYPATYLVSPWEQQVVSYQWAREPQQWEEWVALTPSGRLRITGHRDAASPGEKVLCKVPELHLATCQLILDSLNLELNNGESCHLEDMNNHVAEALTFFIREAA